MSNEVFIQAQTFQSYIVLVTPKNGIKKHNIHIFKTDVTITL